MMMTNLLPLLFLLCVEEPDLDLERERAAAAAANMPARPTVRVATRTPAVRQAQPARATGEPGARQGYPIRSGWWTGCPDWRHLTHGVHAGKYDHAWLRSLSNAELQSLHSDDHEGRVKTQHVVRPGQQRREVVPSPASTRPQGRAPRAGQWCPT